VFSFGYAQDGVCGKRKLKALNGPPSHEASIFAKATTDKMADKTKAKPGRLFCLDCRILQSFLLRKQEGLSVITDFTGNTGLQVFGKYFNISQKKGCLPYKGLYNDGSCVIY